MKLLEVDEAANHIRDLVDPNANIIWGSAFNPDLDGKIRVSVVATGIEQNTQQAEEASRPFSLGGSRGPMRPSVAVPVTPAVAVQTVPAPAAPAAPEGERQSFMAVPAEVPPATGGASEPFELGTEHEAPGAPASSFPAPVLDGAVSESSGTVPVVATNQDELLLDASRLAAEDGPVTPLLRRKPLTFQQDEEGAAPATPVTPQPRLGLTAEGAAAARPASGGGTLFERMANLTKTRKAEDGEDEGEEDGGAISIPRFLGRQNNQ
jgi:cell division protein FtsZ